MTTKVGREFDSRRLRTCYLLFSTVRAGDIVNDYCTVVFSRILLVRGEGRAPEIFFNESAEFDELENAYLFVLWYYTLACGVT